MCGRRIVWAIRGGGGGRVSGVGFGLVLLWPFLKNCCSLQFVGGSLCVEFGEGRR